MRFVFLMLAGFRGALSVASSDSCNSADVNSMMQAQMLVQKQMSDDQPDGEEETQPIVHDPAREAEATLDYECSQHRETGGTCRFFGCYGYRNADCVEGRCVCPDGKCSAHSDGTDQARCKTPEWWSRSMCGARNQYLAEGATCAVCDPGSFLDQTPSRVRYCAACPSGRFRDQEGGERSRSCSYCPAGKSSEPGSTSCSDCQAGRFSELWSPTCSACPAGTTSEAGSATCSDCAAGRFKEEGSATCTDCAAGRFAEEGSATCSNCEAGSFAQEGSGSCTDCPAGRFAANDQSGTCSECLSNQWSEVGSTACSEWNAQYSRGDAFGRCPEGSERLSNEQCHLAVGSDVQGQNFVSTATMGSLQEGTESGMAVPGRGCYVDQYNKLWRNPDGTGETSHSGSNNIYSTALCFELVTQDDSEDE